LRWHFEVDRSEKLTRSFPESAKRNNRQSLARLWKTPHKQVFLNRKVWENIQLLLDEGDPGVLGISRTARCVPGVERVYRTRALAPALARADFVVLTLPLSAATRGLIGASALAAMKPSAWLINLARGPIVDEAALLDALRARRIGGAILDVFDTEPLPPDHPLWALDNVVVTPHISGPSTVREIAPIFADNLRRYLAGRPLRHLVDRRRGY